MIYISRTFQQSLRSGRHLKTFVLVAVVITLGHWSWMKWSLGIEWKSMTLHKPATKIAFATLLLPSNTNSTFQSLEKDGDAYFLSTRMLNYQLQHCNKTRSREPIPFLVLVTPEVPSNQCEILQNEGATIVPVEKLPLAWMQPLDERWRDVMVKLRLFQLTFYDQILFFDADTFVMHPLDGIFNDPAAQTRQTLNITPLEPDEAPLPPTYLFATLPEVVHKSHTYPPITYPYFNAGFFLLSPSIQLFNYYISLLNLPGRFDSTYPEQNLLNYAHRETGNMPWGRLGYKWNINLPNMRDVEGGVKSVHEKLWTEGSVLKPTELGLRRRWREVREEMEVFYGEAE